MSQNLLREDKSQNGSNKINGKKGYEQQVMIMPRVGWLSSMTSRNDIFKEVNKRFHKIKRYDHSFEIPS